LPAKNETTDEKLFRERLINLLLKLHSGKQLVISTAAVSATAAELELVAQLWFDQLYGKIAADQLEKTVYAALESKIRASAQSANARFATAINAGDVFGYWSVGYYSQLEKDEFKARNAAWVCETCKNTGEYTVYDPRIKQNVTFPCHWCKERAAKAAEEAARLARVAEAEAARLAAAEAKADDEEGTVH
jgi:hypothetical protein